MKIQIVFALVIATIFACGGGGEKNSDNSNASESEKMAALVAGKKAFQTCIACHGPDGKLGVNGAKDFAESTLSLEERIEIITNGKGMMTAYKGILKPEQIEAAAKYTIHLGKQGK